MSVSVQEVLMGLGQFDVELDWSPDLVSELAFFRHLLFWWGEELIFAGPILTRQRSRDLLKIGGRSLEWWLGMDKDGPLIEDRTYIASTNKLSNPGFEQQDLYWRTSETSKWTWPASNARSGTYCAQTTADSADAKDDVLSSTETWESAAGASYSLSGYVERLSGSVGRVRLRAIFEGRFNPTNLVPNGNFESGNSGWSGSNGQSVIANDSGNAQNGSYVLKLGPNPQPEMLSNGGFASGALGAWSDTGLGTDTWAVANTEHWDDSYALKSTGSGVLAVGLTGRVEQANIGVKEGEEYRIRGHVMCNDATTDGVAYFWLTYNGSPGADRMLGRVKGNADSTSGWQEFGEDWGVPGSTTSAALVLATINHVNGKYWFDGFSMIRIAGNTDSITSSSFAVVPERTYKFQASVRTGPNIQGSGEVFFAVVCTSSGGGRPTKSFATKSVSLTANTWHNVTLDVSPPSGYDTAQVKVFSGDILADSIYVDDITLIDADKATTVVDLVSGTAAGSYTQIAGTAAAPSGTERVRLDVISEDKGGGWCVDDIVFSRNGGPTSTTTILDDLLKNPATGTSILTAGTISGGDNILYDWHAKNLTNREALQYVSRSGVALPNREWRVNPTATLDWGTAAQLFADRTDVVLTDGDLVLLGTPQADTTGENQLTKVKVVGADRPRPGAPFGLTTQITGTSTASAGSAVDWFGNPLSRTRVVEDSRVDHQSFANSYADYLVGFVNGQRTNIQFALSDWRQVGRFSVGDWIYAYSEEAGLVDATRERDLAGRTVYPQRSRVLSRTWKLARSTFRIEVRRPDGTTLDISDSVRWEQSTSSDIEVGDFYPEWTADPLGPAPGNQFLNFRSSAVR